MPFRNIFFVLTAFIFAVAAVSEATAGLRITERTKFYSISGKTGKQIFGSITRRGPRRGHAIATTKTSVQVRNLRTKIRGRRCVVRSADVIVKLTYTLPRWRASRRASKRVQKGWKAFSARVKRHEDVHGQISKKYAKRLYREILRMKGRVSRKCSDFGEKASRRIARLQRRADREHARFDRREGSRRARVRRLQLALLKAR